MIGQNTKEILSSTAYKRSYLPFLDAQILNNENTIQLFLIEHYLHGILMAQTVYRTAFSFMIFVTENTVQQQVNQHTFEVSAGECIYIRQGAWTRTLKVHENAKGYVLIYEHDVLTHYFLTHGQQHSWKYVPYYRFDNFEFESITTSLQLLKNELLSPIERPSVSLALFYSILSRLNYYQSEKDYNTRDFEIAYQFKQLVQRHHIESRTVTFYAERLHISEHYLNRCVKKVTNQSAKQWINDVNIQYSQLLLQDRSIDIATIAYELNYPSPSYFSRVFKKITGYTPKEYRRALQLESKRILPEITDTGNPDALAP